ncbi:MAG: HIT family protein [Kangiella sp.]|nr:MAG: HIT family protein [Kangiella sp.]
MSCPFCDIRDQKEPAFVILDEEHCMAILDNKPKTEGHILVIPKIHCEHFSELDEQSAVAMMQMASKITKKLKLSELTTDGFNLFLTEGKAGGQQVPHAHLHVIPRVLHDGIRLSCLKKSFYQRAKKNRGFDRFWSDYE